MPSALVTRYFQLVTNRQFTEAERELDRIKQKMQKTEWNRGYFRALYGIFLSRRSNGDSYAFFPKLDLSNKATLNAHRREFLGHVGNKLHGDFDRGYFSAWADCMRVLSRIGTSGVSKSNEAATKSEDHEKAKSGKSQATMEGFLGTEED